MSGVRSEDTFYIYMISNIVNDKLYFGQSIDWKVRKQSHWAAARRGEDILLYRAMRYHGLDKFKFEVIDTVFSQAEADDLETYLISKYGTRNPSKGYNIAAGGRSGATGIVPSQETRIKIGRNNPKFRKDICPEQVKELKESGISVNQIAKQIGVSRRCIERLLKDAGIILPNRRREREKRLREEGKEDFITITLEKIKPLYYDEQKTAQEVGEQFLVTGETILSYLRAADLPIRNESSYKRKPQDGHQVCTVCKKSKPLEEFGVHRGLSNGRHFRCRECQREYDRLHDKRRTKSEAVRESDLGTEQMPGLSSVPPASCFSSPEQYISS